VCVSSELAEGRDRGSVRPRHVCGRHASAQGSAASTAARCAAPPLSVAPSRHSRLPEPPSASGVAGSLWRQTTPGACNAGATSHRSRKLASVATDLQSPRRRRGRFQPSRECTPPNSPPPPHVPVQDEGKGVGARKFNTPKFVDHFYSLITDFYEYGWCAPAPETHRTAAPRLAYARRPHCAYGARGATPSAPSPPLRCRLPRDESLV
jgi:hypothetical protein